MALPSFLSTRGQKPSPFNSDSEKTPSSLQTLSKATIKRATRTRFCFALLSSFCFLVSLVFVILVEVGNISSNRPVVSSIWFLKLDLSNIIPSSVPNTVLINTVARTLGLHDYYQVGLWNFCEGNINDTFSCTKPRTLYWFDPVSIIQSELLAGASIALPSNIAMILGLVRTISHIMFGLFLVSAPLSFLCVLLTPLSVNSRLLTLPIACLALLCALTTTAACTIATAMFIIFRNVIVKFGADINITASVGVKMFAFMWTAAAGAVIGWLVQMGLCCCCASRRDVKRGKKMGRRSAYKDGEVPVTRQKKKKGWRTKEWWKRMA